MPAAATTAAQTAEPTAHWLRTFPTRLPQVLLNDDNIADIQAEYEGPGECPAAGGTSCCVVCCSWLLFARPVGLALPACPMRSSPGRLCCCSGDPL